jgi:hypothetical protein
MRDVAKTLKKDLPGELHAAIQWLEQLDIQYSRTRFGRYKRILDQLETARLAQATRIRIDSPWVKNETLYDAVRRLDAAATLFEANELVMIHQGLAGKGLDTYLSPRLEELVSGPESYANENATKTNRARNKGFELAIIARLAQAGLTVQQDEGLADVVACLGETTYIVECKRPYSKAGVAEAIRKAGDQLETRYEHSRCTDAVGFIALDLTRVFNAKLNVGDSFFFQREFEAKITGDMDALVAEYGEQFDRVTNKRTAGVLLRYSELAWVESTGTMSWFHKYGVTPFTRRSPAKVDTVWAVRSALERLRLSEGLNAR